MFENFADTSRRVVVVAQETARRLRHDYIGTEHLLLAVAETESAGVRTLLSRYGVDEGRVRTRVEALVPAGTSAHEGHIPFTSRAKRALLLSARQAQELQGLEVLPEHLLLGLLQEEEGVAAQVLRTFGCTFDDLRRQVQIPRVDDRSVSAPLEVLERLEAKVDRLTSLIERLPGATSLGPDHGTPASD